MIISTKKGTPKDELEKIVDKFENQGLDVTLITGKDYNVFGLVGDTTKIDERDVLANPWIDAKRLEGIQIVLVPKNGKAPATRYQGITSVRTQAYIKK